MISRLSSRTRQLVVEHNERTGHFVRACGAFGYITIPAISCPMVRFDLYVLSSQVALTNECLGQADACLEGAINLIPELPASEEQWIISHTCNLLSTLLVQPVKRLVSLLFFSPYRSKIQATHQWTIVNRTLPVRVDCTICADFYVTSGTFPSAIR